MTCADCKHYSRNNEKEGDCRRYPPQLAAVNYSQFPGVKADWNCGEFQGDSVYDVFSEDVPKRKPGRPRKA